MKKSSSSDHPHSYCLVYITCANAEEAQAIGTTLVKQRLVACANILPSIQSIYWWQGQVEQATEWALIAKTRRSLVADLTQKVKEMHSYDLPCVVALPLDSAAVDVLAWIDQETQTLGDRS